MDAAVAALRPTADLLLLPCDTTVTVRPAEHQLALFVDFTSFIRTSHHCSRRSVSKHSLVYIWGRPQPLHVVRFNCQE